MPMGENDGMIYMRQHEIEIFKYTVPLFHPNLLKYKFKNQNYYE